MDVDVWCVVVFDEGVDVFRFMKKVWLCGILGSDYSFGCGGGEFY